MKKVNVDGGEPVFLCDAPNSRGASWGPDNNIVAALDTSSGLSLVPSEGGKLRPLTKLSFGETTHRWPQFLPGGEAVLFTISGAYGNFDEAGIAVVSLKHGQTKTVIEHAGMYPRYVSTGHLLYVTNGTLFAARFNPERLEASGSAKMTQEVISNPWIGFAEFDVSQDGTLVYRAGRTENRFTITWLDRAGKSEPVGIEPGAYFNPLLAPDGSRILYLALQGSTSDLWIYDWQRDSKTRLTNGRTILFPVWSRDGRFVVFQAAGGMFWTRSDGVGEAQVLTRSNNLQLPFSFTPDGTRLAYTELIPGGGAEIRTLAVERSPDQLKAGASESFLETSTTNTFTAFSPDGRWVAYTDPEAGRNEVYVQSFPKKGIKIPISNSGGTTPVWGMNELLYRSEDRRIMVVSYKVRGELFIAEKPRVWSDRPLVSAGNSVNFDLAPDGKRAVALIPAEGAVRESQNHVALIVNFFDELRRRVGVQQE